LAKKRDKGWKSVLPLIFLLLIPTLLLAQPPSQPDDASLFREGEILLSKGEPEKALWRFKRLTTEFPKSPLFNEAKFRMGICYTLLRKPQEAIRVLTELLPTFLSPSRMIKVFTLLGDNHLELNDLQLALHWYGKGILVPGQSNEELKKKVRSIIDPIDSIDELSKIESFYRGAYAGGYAKLRRAQLLRKEGNESLAKKLLIEIQKEYQGVDYLSSVIEILGSISIKSKYTVGVILPLSGPYQSFGQKVLQAIQMAINEAQTQEGIPLISLSVHDSKGDPLEVEKAIETLAIKEKAIAIIGPILSLNIERAAKRAQQLRIPLLTLSPKDSIFGKGEFIFQVSFTPSEQVVTLLDYAFKELGHHTFGIFYPYSPYGLHFKNLFAQEVRLRGGKMIGMVAYQEHQTDFSQEIKTFFKLEPLSQPDSKKKRSEEFKATVRVDALFIPDTHERVGMILSQMAYYDIKGLTFLGINSWNGPGLISIGGRGVEGSIFVDGFFKKSSSRLVSSFVQEFKKAYQREPEILEALGYDGIKFLKEILQSKTLSSPSQLKDEIYKVQGFQGVTGLKGFDEVGRPIRTLYILKVNQGQIEQVSPPLKDAEQ